MDVNHKLRHVKNVMFVSTLKITLDLTQTLAPDQGGIQSVPWGLLPSPLCPDPWGWGAFTVPSV